MYLLKAGLSHLLACQELLQILIEADLDLVVLDLAVLDLLNLAVQDLVVNLAQDLVQVVVIHSVGVILEIILLAAKIMTELLGGKWVKKNFVFFNSTSTKLRHVFTSYSLAIIASFRQHPEVWLNAGKLYQFIEHPTLGQADLNSQLEIPLNKLVVFDFLPVKHYKLRFEPLNQIKSLNPLILTIFEPSMPLYSNATSNTTTTSVATNTVAVDSTKSVILSSADSSKIGRIIVNNSTKGALYINFKNAASLTDYVVKVPTNNTYEVPFGFTGDINGIWDKADNTGNAKVYEFS